MITSTATIESVPASLNGTTIGCAGLDIVFTYVTINVTGPPKLPVSYTTMPINDSALVINWAETEQCISNYTITITTNNTITENNIVNTSSATFDNLVIGTNYSFIIIPIDTVGREGPPSSLIQYIWNVPAQVVNISWYQISTDSITIWWNNNQMLLGLHPPIEYYIINVYITTICINSCSVYSYNVTDTNTTITGLSPINEYYTVTIIPVNVIGYGPSVTVNVSITTTTSSITNIMMSTTEYITTQDKSSAMTALPTITETQLITTTETIISSYIESYASCNTTGTPQATDAGCISVAIAVPITGLLTGLITAIITSIIVCLIMKKRRTAIQNKTPVGGGGGEAAVIGPIYDLPTINTEQQEEQIIDTKLNTAYGQTNL
uniref:Fibronectin type-III domain-containing protein n=1 Tax=Amphimedon queenslandica TaxID=400682 RepID=A0A1X7UG18_AMPQE